MRARHQHYPSPSPFVESGKYFVGVRINPQNVILEPGVTSQMVTLTPSVPIICYDRTNCELSIHVNMENNVKTFCSLLPEIQVTLTDCMVKIPGLKPGDEMKPQNATFWIEAASGADYNSRESNMVTLFKTANFDAKHALWSDINLPPVPHTTEVQVALVPDNRIPDLIRRECFAHNDPHMKTFDNCTYEGQRQGEFVMYRNSFYNTQVNIFTKPCNPGWFWPAYCTCGVGILAGRTQYILDKCHENITEHRHLLLRCEDDWMKIRGNTSSMYTIELRTGTKIEIRVRGNLTNVEIYPSTKDIGFSEGLCGNLDGDKSNDLYDRDNNVNVTCNDSYSEMSESLKSFVDSWKARSGESLWNVKLPDKTSLFSLCGCKKSNARNAATCERGNWTTLCFPKEDITDILERECISMNRRKREAGPNAESDYGNPERPPFNPGPSLPYQKPTWSGNWTEASARALCENAVNKNPVGEACQAVPNVQYKGSADQCVQDIKISGGADWVQDAVEAMKLSCENQVTRNIALWKAPAGGEGRGKALAPPTEITDLLCPLDCSGHGVCMKGVCNCDARYSGKDCSIDMQQPPFNVQTTGDCDISRRPCRATAIFGSTFLNSYQLMCRVQTIELTTAGSIAVGGAHLYPAEYLDRTKIMCPLPQTDDSRAKRAASQKLGHGYTISVSNDNKTFSSETSLLSFDTICIECQEANNCSIKENTCLIEGACYVSGGKRPGAECYECVPAASITEWQWTNGCLINGNCYTENSTKLGEPCMTCRPSQDKDGWTQKENTCLIEKACYVSGGKKPGAECYECVPAASVTEWQWTNGCVIEGKCFTENSTKLDESCKACKPDKDNEAWIRKEKTCYIDNQCYSEGDRNHIDNCYTCDSTVSDRWTPTSSKCNTLPPKSTTTNFEPDQSETTESGQILGSTVAGNTTPPVKPNASSKSLTIGLTVGGVVVAITSVAVIIWIIKTKCGNLRKSSPENVYEDINEKQIEEARRKYACDNVYMTMKTFSDKTTKYINN